MDRRIKFLLLAWFILSWPVIIAFSLKPIGAANIVKSLVLPLIRNIAPPKTILLCDFEVAADLYQWSSSGVSMELSKDHAASGQYSAKLTYCANTVMPRMVCQDNLLGPFGARDWSFFKFFKLFVFNPQDTILVLHIKIKDRAGRFIDKEVSLNPKNNEVVFALEDLGQFLDLTNISYLNFYFINISQDTAIYLDSIYLERGDLGVRRILDKPILNLVSLSSPDQAKSGQTIEISAAFSIVEKLNHDYWLFIHISHVSEIKKPSRERKYYLAVNLAPNPAVSVWEPGRPYEIGPLRIFLPKDFPSGEYMVQVGLYNPAAQGSYYKGSACYGRMDFRAGFPRLRFIDKRFKNYLVGKIEVSN